MFEKNWKKHWIFWKVAFFEDFLEKNALNRGLALFSAVWKTHYTGDRTNWNRTNRGIPVHYRTMCNNFDWKYSFQYTWRKVVHLSSLAFSTHPSYHHTSDLVFCHFYKNLDEKRNQTISLWQQCSSSTWLDVNT